MLNSDKSCFENSVDSDQLASEKPADQDPNYLFVWFDSLHPINNLSVKQGRVFLGWTSTKLG